MHRPGNVDWESNTSTRHLLVGARSHDLRTRLREHESRVDMIRGVHTMFYSSEPAELRAFIRDKLGFEGVDVGDGWLIFRLPEADMGCHPLESDGPPSGTPYLSFYCDDIAATVSELKGRGVIFDDEIHDVGYGRATHFQMPGDFSVQLFQPYYEK